MPHIATSLGIRKDAKFRKAYWEAFERFFGPANSQVIKAMLLAKTPIGDTGEEEIDRVCYGLRSTSEWLAYAIERDALKNLSVRVDSEHRKGGGQEGNQEFGMERASGQNSR